MGMFELESEPGEHDIFKPCPECSEDKIYRTRESVFDFANGRIFTPFDYYCDSCGYEASKREVVKSFSKLVDDVKSEEKLGLESISDPGLREQVEDRQAEGWEIAEIDQKNERVVMENTSGGTIGGHTLTGLATGLWTFGAGNVAYEKLSKKKNTERIALRSKESVPEESNELKQITDISTKLRELKDLKEEEIITDREFEEKKESLLEEY
ncbi:hypothetical protein SAMN04487967_1252 [Natronorubrum sediminis]|uniref:DUF8108 domain-containing protein n=1 Tax=Natronorubrum sediminis TaxID=640943 RepID=A0A1H6FSP1_9EURY|nr:hypothetical protein [Natronorubrum sediminis]SEH13260.1 hypothetical protein SAMN04487967_1252 [Natronorubrum sediminis]